MLLCTDGLTRIVPDGVVSTSISRLREPQRICDHLVQTATHSGGADDITVLIVAIVDSGAVTGNPRNSQLEHTSWQSSF